MLGVGDINGIMRGKRIPASHWPTICKDGNALSIALFALDMTIDVWDTPYVNFDNGYPDMHMFPNGQIYPLPWEEGVAFCFGRAEGMDHKPVPIDPRGALIWMCWNGRREGLRKSISAPNWNSTCSTRKPCVHADSGIQVYSLARAAELEHVIGPIRRHLNDVGIPIEQSNPEYAPGQVEVNIRYGEALTTADRVVAFRGLVKELALAKGYIATFMSKPFAELSGNGFHAHHSIMKDGKNIFSDGGKLSAIGHELSGRHAAAHVRNGACRATTPNAYRRRQPYTFCPVNNSWDYDNRTVGLRVIEGSEHATRVEIRDGSADCNPYYLLACQIAAGLDGIEQGLEPPPPIKGNGYETEEPILLPADLGTAVELAKNSDFMKGVLGEDRSRHSHRPGGTRTRLHGGSGDRGRSRTLSDELLMKIARVTGQPPGTIKDSQLAGQKWLVRRHSRCRRHGSGKLRGGARRVQRRAWRHGAGGHGLGGAAAAGNQRRADRCDRGRDHR